MSDNLEQNVDFIINEPAFKAASEKVKGNIVGIGVTSDQVAAKVNANIQKTMTPQLGLIEGLKTKMSEYEAKKEKAFSTTAIEIYNAKIQALQGEIDKLNNIGKQGFDDFGNKIGASLDKPIGKFNRLKFALKSYEDMAANSMNPAIISKYNAKIEQTTAELARVKSMGKTGFDEMGNAAARSTNAVGKAWSGLRVMANVLPGVGIAGILAFAIEPITTYLASINLFNEKIAEAIRLKAMLAETALKGNQAATGELTNLRLQYKALTDSNIALTTKKEVYAQIQKDYPAYFKNITFEQAQAGKAAKAYNELTSAILATARARAYSDRITENTNRELENEEKAKVLESEILKLEAKKSASKNRAFEEATKSTKEGAAIGDLTKSNDLQGAINDKIKEKNNLLTDSKLLNRQNLELEQRALKEIGKGGKLSGGAGKDAVTAKPGKSEDTMLAQQRALMQKITDINNEYDRKSMTRDEAELEAIRDKFAKISKEVADFNADPKNKYKVDGSGLNDTKDKALEDLTYRQQTERIKINIEEQKKVYADYELFKTAFGEEQAKRRFATLINTNQTYLDSLKTSFALTYAQGTSTGFDGKTKERLSSLGKAIKTEKEADQKHNDELLKQFQSYAEKRVLIQEKYMGIANGFRAKNQEANAQVAIEEGKRELAALDANEIQKMGSYLRLFNFIGKRTKQQTLDAIEQYQLDLNAFKGTAEEKAKAQKELNEFKDKLKTGSTKELSEIINQLQQVGSIFDNINGNIGSITSVLLNSAKAYLDIKSGIDDIQDPDKSTTDKIGAGLGIAGAAISIANSVFGYFKGLKAAKEAARKAMADYQAAATKGELDYQSLLRKRAADDIVRGKNSYQAIIAQLELLKKQSPEIQAAYERIFNSLQGQSSVSGVGYKHGTWLRKAKTWDIMASLAGAQYEELEKLYTQGKLKDQAKSDFESLRALREELKAAGISVDDLQKQLTELLTGTTVAGLADSLAELFENGKFAAADFGKSFEDIMRNAIISSFKVKFLQDKMQPFLDELGELMKAGTPDQTAIDELKKKYEAIGMWGADYWKELERISGIKLTNQSTGQSGTGIGGIAREMQTEETASKIEGLARAQYELEKNHLTVSMEALAFIKLGQLNLMEIAKNTGEMVAEGKNIVTELQTLRKDLKGQGARAVS